MRFVFLSGGLVGFTLVAITGWWADRAADRIFFDASLGALAGSLLFRWLWNVLLQGLRETYLVRQRAAAAAEQAKAKS
ncbi:MAG TPA: hypothetical protein VFJ90_02900 [Candidatus Didemnitutus sp.]|nr:hypothetical protein [Candidatus Didemnitutus sp.]